MTKISLLQIQWSRHEICGPQDLDVLGLVIWRQEGSLGRLNPEILRNMQDAIGCTMLTPDRFIGGDILARVDEARAEYCSFCTINQPTKLYKTDIPNAQTHAWSSCAIDCNPSQLSVPWNPVSHTGIQKLFVAGGPRASRHDEAFLSTSERNSGSLAMPLLPQNAIHPLHLTIAG